MAVMELAGTVVRGHRVASGRCGDPRFPDGTISPQLPFLRERIADLDEYLGGPPFAGTVNVRVDRPAAPDRPELHLRDVPWTPVFPPESFYLAHARLRHAGTEVPAFLYMPDPVAKPDHVQRGDTLEFLARHVPGLRYGSRVVVTLPAGTLRLS